MKYTIRVLALATVLALLAGCGPLPFELPFDLPFGNTAAPAQEASVEEAPAAFGVGDIAGTPELQAETTQAVEIAPPEETEEEASASEEEAPEEVKVDLTEAQVKSALCAAYFTDVAYDPADPIYFWRSVCYMTILAEDQIEGAKREKTTVIAYDENGEAAEEEAELIRIPAEALDPLVTALFGPYDEQYPSLSEEDPRVAWESTEDGEFYVITLRDLADWTVDLGEGEADEDGVTVYEVTFSDEGEPVAVYRVEMEAYPEDAAGSDIFSACVTDVEFVETPES